MIHMMEVIGISSESYSDAAKNAIKKLLDNGQKLYWFEVVEQRGAVKNGEVEFQIKLKIAVEGK